MNLDDIFDSASLKATDLRGQEATVTIASFETKDFDDGAKIILTFAGKEKTLICNKTNATTIAGLHGKRLEDWIGKQITLFPTQTDFQGKQVECIRVRLQPPARVSHPHE